MIEAKIYPVTSARLPVQNPFILIAQHVDHYPQGNGQMAPVEFPSDWEKGNDFQSKRGWNMYHGEYVPGFPAHPHRGFETISYVRKGVVDHFDSQGNYGRYGNGDIQWMVSGKGLQHAEMFPLVHTDKGNLFEIFQIWLNLPSSMKMVDPTYKMHWSENIPVVHLSDTNPEKNYLKVLVGHYFKTHAEKPVETSYGYAENNHINIWDGVIEKDERFVIPHYPSDVNVQLYVAKGVLEVEDFVVNQDSLLIYKSDQETTFVAKEDTQFMVFIGKEIKEEVFAHGPFVMNTREEIIQAYNDYEETQFGGWPWSSYAPTIEPEKERFSVHDHGSKTSYPPKQEHSTA